MSASNESLSGDTVTVFTQNSHSFVIGSGKIRTFEFLEASKGVVSIIGMIIKLDFQSLKIYKSSCVMMVIVINEIAITQNHLFLAKNDRFNFLFFIPY